ESTHDEYHTIHPDDPNSASVDLTWTELFERGDWRVTTRTHTRMTSTPDHYIVVASLEAREGDEIIHQQSWERKFDRLHV
ncbi:MAG: peptidase S15, partial [Gammaproteobacteria bacterium]|nr:peptidase S15 [Gammaproteobacteria bacterium]